MNATRTLYDLQRWKWWETLFWLIALASPWVLGRHALIINEIAIVALFAMSLDLILGYSGIVSLGHAAFFGMGAYAAALFAKHIHPEPVYGMLFAIAVSTVFGAVASLSIMRGSDLTRLMVTVGVAAICLELANKLDWLTGGADGLQGVVMGPILGQFEFDLFGQISATYSMVVLFIFFLLARRLVNSPLGGTLKAMRDNRLRAQSIGIPVIQRTALIYTIAAGVAGASGALLAQTSSFAAVEYFSFERSADLVLLVVIGGAGWLYGGVIGAVIFKALQDWLSNITPQYWMFWLGLFLVVLMLVGRERLMGWLRRPFEQLFARIGGAR